MKRHEDQPFIFSFEYPPISGGISRLCSEIVEQSLLHKGLHFQVLTEGVNQPLDDENGVWRVNSRRPWRELAALRRLKSFSGMNYCICGLWYPEGLLATLVGVRHRIILAHGSELMPARQLWRRGIWNWLQQWVLRSADLVVANSQYTAELVKKSSPSTKVVAVPLAVDPLHFCPGSMSDARKKLALPNKLILSSVTRIQSYKGIDTVLRALAHMSPMDRERFHYVIAGRGSDRAALEAMAAELGVAQNIQWLGFVSDDDLPAVYQASDVFVLCTRESIVRREVEGFGLVFLEAQACGTPVIGTRGGGIPDAVTDEQGGWLIPMDDHVESARRLCLLAATPKLLAEQRKIARERVMAGFTWQQYINNFFARLNESGVLSE